MHKKPEDVIRGLKDAIRRSASGKEHNLTDLYILNLTIWEGDLHNFIEQQLEIDRDAQLHSRVERNAIRMFFGFSESTMWNNTSYSVSMLLKHYFKNCSVNKVWGWRK